jgi:ribosomal protein S18 acetylase RimI-like enzyme
MSTSIQRATIADRQVLLPLVQAFHEFENLQLTATQRESSIAALLTNATFGGIWLIFHDGELVGYIALCLGYSIEFSGKDAFIDEFYIRPEFRGQGIGRATLELITVAAKTLDVRAIHLEVARTNTRAQKLYAQANFKAREKYVLMSVTL